MREQRVLLIRRKLRLAVVLIATLVLVVYPSWSPSIYAETAPVSGLGPAAMVSPQLITPADSASIRGTSLVSMWSPVDGAIAYVYENFSSADTTQPPLLRDITTDTQEIIPVTSDATLWWHVKAIGELGSESLWSELWSVTIDNTVPSVPVGGVPHDIVTTTNELDFAWASSSDSQPGVTYELRLSSNPGEVGPNDTTAAWSSGPLGGAAFHSSGLPNGVWYWQVRSLDRAGNTSAWSEVWNVTIDVAPTPPPPPPPVAPTLTMDAALTGRSVAGTVSSLQAIFTVKIDGNLRSDVSVIVADLGEGIHGWQFALPDDAVDGLSHVIEVTATVDGLSATETGSFMLMVGGVSETSGSAQTQELLDQLARLNEPFAVPGSFTTVVTPRILRDATHSPSSDVSEPLTFGLMQPQGVDTIAAVPTENGWKLFGVLWYWWGLVVVLLATGTIWFSTTGRRRRIDTVSLMYEEDQS